MASSSIWVSLPELSTLKTHGGVKTAKKSFWKLKLTAQFNRESWRRVALSELRDRFQVGLSPTTT
jgi:hypothetical protein